MTAGHSNGVLTSDPFGNIMTMNAGEIVRVRAAIDDELVWVTLQTGDPNQGQVVGEFLDGLFELPYRFLLPSSSVIHFTAIPESGFVFDQWSDGVKKNPRTMTPDRETSLVAEFRQGDALAPVIISAPDTITVRRGDEIEIEVVVEGDSPLSFQWFDADNRPFPGAVGPVLKTIVGTERYFSGEIRLEVQNSVGMAVERVRLDFVKTINLVPIKIIPDSN